MSKIIKTRGFSPLVMMIFLNAFVDLGHKITIQNTIFKLYDGSTQIILTAIVNALILLPFILFFRPAGLAADIYSKTKVLRLASAFVLLLTCGLAICYFFGWFQAAFALTFVIAIQSAFYAPSKYGLLRELIDNEHLARANGIAQAMATTGILAGIFCFSVLFEMRFTQVEILNEQTILKAMFPLSWLLIFSSLMETMLAWSLPVLASNKQNVDKTPIVKDLKSLKNDRALWAAIIGTSVFWCVGQILVATYPAFAKESLGISNTIVVQGLLAMIGVGTLFGSIIAGKLSHHHIEINLLPLAATGIIATIFFIPFTPSTPVAAGLFFTLGVFGGFLVVPLNALIQYCSKPAALGKSIAYTSLIQNICMLSCLIITMVAAMVGIKVIYLLIFVGLLAFVGILYVLLLLPHCLLRFKISPLILGQKKLYIEGFNKVQGYGEVLFVVNGLNQRKQVLLQLACPRKLSCDLNMPYAVISLQQWQTSFQQDQILPEQNRKDRQHVFCELEETASLISVKFSATEND